MRSRERTNERSASGNICSLKTTTSTSGGISISMTRFGKISPLWKKFRSLWQIFDGYFLLLQNAEPTLANLRQNWANLHCCKWPNVEKYSNHLVTLISVNFSKKPKSSFKSLRPNFGFFLFCVEKEGASAVCCSNSGS